MPPSTTLPPYTRCTHEGPSVALVLPDGEELLLANIDPLLVHGIAPGHPGRKLRLRSVGGTVELFPMSREAPPTGGSRGTPRKAVPPGNRVSLKDARDGESVTMAPGQTLDFVYDEKMPGWKQA